MRISNRSINAHVSEHQNWIAGLPLVKYSFSADILMRRSFFQCKWEVLHATFSNLRKISGVIFVWLRFLSLNICSIGDSACLCMRSIVWTLESTSATEHYSELFIFYCAKGKNISMLTSFIIRLFGNPLECSRTVCDGFYALERS